MFRLLAAVPATGEADAVDLAFQSVQLTCSDYMAAMPFARLKRCLEVAVLYSSQQADVNVSLTTISLLWNAADLFGKGAGAGAALSRTVTVRPGSAAAEDDESDTEVEAAVVAVPLPAPDAAGGGLESEEEEAASPSGKRSQLAARLTPAQTEELLQMIFLALQVGCCGWCEPYWEAGCLPGSWELGGWVIGAHLRPVHLPTQPPAGRQPGRAARGAQQRRAHAVCGGGQPGSPPLPRPLGAVPVGDAVPPAQPRLPHVCHCQP